MTSRNSARDSRTRSTRWGRKLSGRPGQRSLVSATRSGARSTGEQPTVTGAQTPATRRTPGQAGREQTRLTSRAAILLLVVALLAMSFASSMRAYLQQREQIAELKSTIAERNDNIRALEREKKRWEDPNYVQAQARDRLGYLFPGEIGFEVLGADGQPLGGSELDKPSVSELPDPWWNRAWESVELAGNPPTKKDLPAKKIGDDSPVGGSTGVSE